MRINLEREGIHQMVIDYCSGKDMRDMAGGKKG